MYCLEAGKHLVKFGWNHGFSKVAAIRHKPLLKTWLLGGFCEVVPTTWYLLRQGLILSRFVF